MDTLGTIREIARLPDYSRFGRRQSPTSIIGSRISSASSSASSGCWCPYALIVLLVIFVIASLVASNFSIYFLMKDNCDANLAKFEREMATKPKRRPESSPNSDAFDLNRFLNKSPPTLKPVAMSLETSTQATSAGTPSAFVTRSSTTNNNSVSSSSQRTQAEFNFVPVSKREKNVAGILQLVATIRIPQQSEISDQPPETYVDPKLQDEFDLAKYFSIKQHQTSTAKDST